MTRHIKNGTNGLGTEGSWLDGSRTRPGESELERLPESIYPTESETTE